MRSFSKDIIIRAQAGDRDAFAQVVADHYEMILRIANKYCGNRDDAEDITQQACVKLARVIGQFRFESAFSTWLYRLVINCAKDWYKSQKINSQDKPPDIAVNNNAESAVMLIQVLALVEAMGEGFRETVILVIGEGFTHAEAALVLEVKESTVSWRLHEIRKRLKAQFQPGSGL